MMNEPKLTLHEHSCAGKESCPPPGESAGTFEPHTAAKIANLTLTKWSLWAVKKKIVGSITPLRLEEDFLDS